MSKCKRLVTIISVVSLLSLLPGTLTHAGRSIPFPDKSRRSFCATCQASQSTSPFDELDKLSTLGRRTQVNPFLPLRRSIFEGLPVNLVSTSSGSLGFGLTDLYLPGLMPIAFQRTYVSDRREDIGLGAGWSFVFTDRIKFEGDVATLTDISGTTTFHRDGESQRFVLQLDEPGIHQQFEMTDTATITERVSDVTRIYKKIGEAFHLTQITGPGGINVLISHDAAGKLIRVANDPGASLVFKWTEGKDARLLAVVDSAGRRVSFRQDGHRLRAVVDADRAEWAYDYSSGGLRQATDPLGRVLLRARYDKSGRVIGAGDAMGLTRYDYEFGSSNVSRRTVVTDPLNAITIYEQTDRGALAAVKDDEDRSMSIEYNAANRPVRLSDSIGDEMTFSYDAKNRLLRQSTNGAVDRAFSFGANGGLSSILEGTERTDLTLDSYGQIIAAQSSDPGRSYTATYNSNGALSQLKSKNRDVSFEYDENGNKTAINYSDSGRFSYERDAAGRVAAAHLPSGLTFFNEYDARGGFLKQSDNLGNAVTVQRDRSGAPIAYITADGKQMRSIRDEAGRVVKETDFAGNVRSLAYNARGALIDYTVRGKHRRFEYDHRGRLSAIVYDEGVTKSVQRDALGKIQSVSYARSAGPRAFNPQVGFLRSMVDRRWAHSPALQDPPPDCCGDDVIVTDIWAPYWPGGAPGSGQHPPLQATGTDGTGGAPAPVDAEACALELLSCAAAIGVYVTSIGILIGVCAESFGLGCLGALLLHPVLGPLAVLRCSKAIKTCQL